MLPAIVIACIARVTTEPISRPAKISRRALPASSHIDCGTGPILGWIANVRAAETLKQVRILTMRGTFWALKNGALKKSAEHLRNTIRKANSASSVKLEPAYRRDSFEADVGIGDELSDHPVPHEG